MNIQKTRCPFCASVFAVTDAQLAIRDGYTRCGKCFQVFKANENLILEKKTASPLSPSPIASVEPDIFASIPSESPELAQANQRALTNRRQIKISEPSTPRPAPTSSTFTQGIDEFNDLWLNAMSKDEEANEQTSVAVVPVHEPQAFIPEEIDPTLTHLGDTLEISEAFADIPDRPQPIITDDDDLISYLSKNNVASTSTQTLPKPQRGILPGLNTPSLGGKKPLNKPKPKPAAYKRASNPVMDRLNKPRSRIKINFARLLGWSFLSLLMLVLLIAQYLYFNFDRLASISKYHPLMYKTCAVVGCDVPLVDLQKIRLDKVIANTYQPAPEDTILTGFIVNTAEESQPFPTLRILIIKNGEVQSGRYIQPPQYLTAEYSPLSKIPANTPTKIEFVLKIPRDQIDSFKLEPVPFTLTLPFESAKPVSAS